MSETGRFSALRHGRGRAIIEHDGRSYEVWVVLSVIGETNIPDHAPLAARWWGTVTGLPASLLGGTHQVTISFEGKPALPAVVSPPDRIRGDGDPLAP